MKQRILLIVAMLLVATPAFATVNITATQGTGADINVITVSYACTASEAVRAFALDLTLGSAGNSMTWNSIFDFSKGESTTPGGGYGIFPGQFRNQINPADPNWDAQYYYPIAPPNDIDSNGTGIGERKIITELGTLYVDGNAPGTSGTLFKVRVDGNGLSSDTLNIAANTVRGGVVLENGSAATTNLPFDQNVVFAPPECFPSSDPAYSDWVALGSPEGWCIPRQCHGDADGLYQGSTKTGLYYVGSDDLNVLFAAWQVKEPPKGDGIASVTFNGIPGINADFAHNVQGSTKTGLYRVGSDDLNVLFASWQVKEVPKGLGVEPNCVP